MKCHVAPSPNRIDFEISIRPYLLPSYISIEQSSRLIDLVPQQHLLRVTKPGHERRKTLRIEINDVIRVRVGEKIQRGRGNAGRRSEFVHSSWVWFYKRAIGRSGRHDQEDIEDGSRIAKTRET
jgi:hypothetical protein